MKTFILQLDPHDDIISVRDKMGWAKNSRILIVWPEQGELLNRRLDLMLLLRHSQRLGSQLAIVSQDWEVRYHAPRLGIPVFKSLHQAETRHWRVPYRFRKRQPLQPEMGPDGKLDKRISSIPERLPAARSEMRPAARLFFFLLGVISLLAIAAILTPSAELLITPQTVVQDVLIDAYSNPEIEEISLSGASPSEIVSVEVEGRLSRPVNGTIRLPDQAAEGMLEFTNLTDQTLEIPEGTVVRPGSDLQAGNLENDAAPLRYATVRDARLPAGPGQTVVVGVQSLTPGKAGNLKAGALTAIEGILGTQLAVTNPGPISGGSDRLEPAPNESDRDTLSDELRSSLRETALHEIENGLSEGDLLIPSSLELVEELEKSFQPEGEQPADQLILSWRLKYQARVVRAAIQQELVRSIFDANLQPGYTPVPDSLQLEPVSPPTTDENQNTTWKLHGVRRLKAQINDSQAVRLALGLPPNQALSRLENSLPLENPPQIRMLPEWWPRLPFLPFRIRITNLNPEPQGS